MSLYCSRFITIIWPPLPLPHFSTNHQIEHLLPPFFLVSTISCFNNSSPMTQPWHDTGRPTTPLMAGSCLSPWLRGPTPLKVTGSISIPLLPRVLLSCLVTITPRPITTTPIHLTRHIQRSQIEVGPTRLSPQVNKLPHPSLYRPHVWKRDPHSIPLEYSIRPSKSPHRGRTRSIPIYFYILKIYFIF